MVFLQNKVEKDAQINHKLANLIRILNQISFPNWELHLLQSECGSYYIQIQFDDTDNYDQYTSFRSYCREWLIQQKDMEDEAHIVRTCWKAYLAALEHEASEKFTYKGKRIYDPHTINLP